MVVLIVSSLFFCCSLKDYVSEDSNGMSNYGEAYKNFKGLVKIINDGILAKAEPKAETSSSSGVRYQYYFYALLPCIFYKQIPMNMNGNTNA